MLLTVIDLSLQNDHADIKVKLAFFEKKIVMWYNSSKKHFHS